MHYRSLAAAALLTLAHAAVIAADTAPQPTPSRSAAPDPLAGARRHIQAHQWPAALEELRRLNAAGNADWNNLMGYALRKQATPDLAGAQQHYDTALRLNPQHRGALEYSGELALMKGDLATAEARLATLSPLCSTPCEELDDLKKAISRYKAGGKP